MGLLAAGREMSWFETLVWPGAGIIGIFLWLMSVGTVAIIVEQFIAIRRGTLLPDPIRQQVQGLFDEKQYREAIEATANEPDLFSHVLHASLAEAVHGYPAMERAMEEAADERSTKLFRRIEWLNLVGNISPMMGLLGTVWGMIQAFFTIVRKGGSPDPGDLAGDIGTALVTTLLGLLIAIPALSVYAIMRNRIDTLSSEAMIAVQGMLSTFRPSKKG